MVIRYQNIGWFDFGQGVHANRGACRGGPGQGKIHDHPTYISSFISYCLDNAEGIEEVETHPRGLEDIYEQGEEMDLLRIILAILLPPLGVFLQVGIGKHFWINILLTLLGYIPGIVHAVWVIAKH